MQGTPGWLKDQIRSYYEATTKKSYLEAWSMEAIALHYGLADEKTASLTEALENNNRFLADALRLQKGMRVFDAGCGVGGTSIWMAAQRGVDAVGVTLDPGQVTLGTQFAQERGVAAHVQLLTMDYMATTFPEASFDAAFNLDSLCHCIDVPAYAEHLLFLLKDDAPYGCLDFYVGRADDDLVKQTTDGWPMPNWQPVEAVAAAFRGAGFADVTVTDLTPQVKLSAEQILAAASNRLLVMKLDAAVGHAESALFEGHVRGAIACSKGLLNGAITYGFVAARRPQR
jgi:tocopherol O-methyltransferase